MRPLLLKLKGFTAFREDQELDFTDLDLFAIAGQTGAGKSSLLDAMTYALYGTVSRVGNQVSQLISQGQPRLAVEFHFEVENERYRVTRSTPASGNTKVILERYEAEEWVPAGEGSDRVGEVNKKITGLLGLDFKGFTRSVLLPQGKFQEFLVGDAAERRNLLTDLLGLSLFKQMAQRANQIATEAKTKAETTAELIESAYEGVSEEALVAARTAVETGVAREEALQKASARVLEIAERWKGTQTIVVSLRGCARDGLAMREVITGAVDALREHLASLSTRAKQQKETATTMKRAQTALEKAAAARADVEKTLGKAAVLIEAKGRAGMLNTMSTELKAVEKAIADAAKRDPVVAKAVQLAEKEHATRAERLETAVKAVIEAREGWSKAQREDLIASVCDGLHRGDACPVCGNTLTIAPPGPSKKAEKAKVVGEKAVEAQEAAQKALRVAEKGLDVAVRDVDSHARERARLDGELAKRKASFDEAAGSLAALFGGTMPADPVGEIGARLAKIETVVDAETSALEAVRRAQDTAQEHDRALASVQASIGTARARVESQPLDALIARARSTGVEASDPPPLPDDPARFTDAAAARAELLTSLVRALDEAAARHGEGERALLAEALEATTGLLPGSDSFERLIAGVTDAVKHATVARAGAQKDVEKLTETLAKRAELVIAAKDQGARADRFKVLARELQANNLIAFLQTEALQVLCLAGTDHLARLSQGRYRLACEDDEFVVIDTWNGDEQRSVKTLSGGETFLASLALALALSEQVHSLSVGRKARLDSLFLDEGFGTLDPDSLREVIDAIEHLGGDGRMVGVITHIAELADQLPAKITIEKSPRGSTISIAR